MVRERVAGDLGLAEGQAGDFGVAHSGPLMMVLPLHTVQFIDDQFLRVQGAHLLFVFLRLVAFGVGSLGLVDFHRARLALLGEIQVGLVPLQAGIIGIVFGCRRGRGAVTGRLPPGDRAAGVGRVAPVTGVLERVLESDILAAGWNWNQVRLGPR